jgi:hypothetical protein
MVGIKMKSPEEIIYEFAEDNLIHYLKKDPGCDLEWIKLIINMSGIKPGDLEDLLNDLEFVGDKRRYKKIVKICRDAKFDCDAII